MEHGTDNDNRCLMTVLLLFTLAECNVRMIIIINITIQYYLEPELRHFNLLTESRIGRRHVKRG